MINRAYIVIPKLIEQPTWGGHYIIDFKGWSDPKLKDKLFGQSYELYSKSNLTLLINSLDPKFISQVDGSTKENTITLESVIKQNPKAVLGEKAYQKFNGQLKTLIKFTQAKGNSFQIHIKTGIKSDRWIAKPESWYFLENGLATLGLSNINRVEEYKKACLELEKIVVNYGSKIRKGEIPLNEAQAKVKNEIDKINIYQYVNLLNIEKNSVIDLSQGGVHHSWEEASHNLPLGNIVYEVQVDVMDDVSTMRSFDKGKIQEGGKTRTLTIEDYFHYIDITKENNNPQSLITKPREIYKDTNCVVENVFATEFYSMDKIDFNDKIPMQFTITNNQSFHHIFVLNGEVNYQDSEVELTISKGHSIFIPAIVMEYNLESLSDKCEVLKTFI